MAIVKVLPRHSAAKVIRYVFKTREPGDRVDVELHGSTNPDHIIAELKAIRAAHNHKSGQIEVFHVIQSWNEKDSAKLSARKANRLGRALVEEYFAGHQYTIVTHTETGKLHNHIVVAALSMANGERKESKFGHRYALMDINDKLCLAHGLSVIDRSKSPTMALKLSDASREIMKEGRKSFVFDLAQKSIWAAHWSRSYDEYALYLGAFGIRVEVENANIVYHYPGMQRPKRGSKMGKAFDKPQLEEKFKANDEKYLKRPELLAEVKGGSASVRAAWEVELRRRASAQAMAPRDYSEFTKRTRRGREGSEHESTEKLKDSLIPPAILEQARGGNILDYCNKHSIPLTDMGDGKLRLKGREHVVVSALETINTKNNQRGNLIDFVASHQQITYLHAISKITGNTRLMLLARAFEEPGRVYNSFRIQNHRIEADKEAKKKLKHFLKERGTSGGVADELLVNQQAQVEKGGAIHLFPRGEPTGSLEYDPHDEKKEPKKHGEFRAPFFSSKGTGRRAVVFTDPLSFVQKRGGDVFSGLSRKDGLLALMEPDAEKVHQYVIENAHVRQLHIVRFTHRAPTKVELDFFENLKNSLAKHQIEVQHVDWDQALEREGPSLSR